MVSWFNCRLRPVSSNLNAFSSFLIKGMGITRHQNNREHRTKDIVADPETTTPNNCTCTSICRCGQEDSDCDPGNPISWWPTSSTMLGEIRDTCNTGYLYLKYFSRD